MDNHGLKQGYTLVDYQEKKWSIIPNKSLRSLLPNGSSMVEVTTNFLKIKDLYWFSDVGVLLTALVFPSSRDDIQPFKNFYIKGIKINAVLKK